VNIQLEVTGSKAVLSEDCKGSVWKSWEGGDDVDNVIGWVIWENNC